MAPNRAFLIRERSETEDDWMTESRCSDKEHDPDIWFNNVPMARMICSMCPVRDLCLAHAMEREQRGDALLGVWGGLSRIQRRRLRNNPTALGMMRKVRRPRTTPSGLFDPEDAEHDSEDHQDDCVLEIDQFRQKRDQRHDGNDERRYGEEGDLAHLVQSTALMATTRLAGMASEM